jgi:hypothetical protein
MQPTLYGYFLLIFTNCNCMVLTRQQKIQMTEFYENHTHPDPNRMGGSQKRLPNPDSSLRMEWNESISYLEPIAETVFREQPHIAGAEFEKVMIDRMMLLKTFRQRLDKIVQKNGYRIKQFNGYSFIWRFMYKVSQDRVLQKKTFAEQVKTMRLNLAFIDRWLKTKPEEIANGRYHITYDLGNVMHAEMPLAVVIRTHKGKPIATVGGYLDYHESKPILRLTNLQGESASNLAGIHYEKRKKIEAALKRMYAHISEALGENWRVHYTKQFTQLAKKNGLGIIGHMPSREEHTHRTTYSRQIRPYRQAYKAAGLTRIPHSIPPKGTPIPAEVIEREIWTTLPMKQPKQQHRTRR